MLAGLAPMLAGLALLSGTVLPAAPARRASSTRRVSLPALVLAPQPSAWDRAVGEACQRGLGRVQGAVVAMDPQTGRVIALVNPRYGLMNAYQPCSVFKIVVAIAGLSEGVITPDTHHVCSKGCWSWPGHGSIDLRRALAVSCNPYFEAVGEQLGYATIERYARLLGLGETSGVNLTGEAAGRLPPRVTPAAVGHLSSHAAGIFTSALQLAVMLSATLNGGIIYQPQVANAEGFVPRERWRLPAGTRLDGLAEGFMAAVNEGSASGAFDPQIVVAGKTGTCAGVGWFASYAPADRPEVVIVVFMRRGNGSGASSIAGRVYENLYGPQLDKATIAAGGGGR